MLGFYDTTSSPDKRAATILGRNQMLGVRETPFFSRLRVLSPNNPVSEPANGIEWRFMIVPEHTTTNNFAEGSEPDAVQHWLSRLSKNHFQIFKKTYGVTRSVGTDSAQALSIQKSLAETAFRKDINYALINNATPTQRVQGGANGLLGGAYSFKSNSNTIDAGNQALSLEMIEETLYLADAKGLDIDTAYMNSNMIAKLSALRRDIARDVVGNTTLVGMNYKEMDMRNSSKAVKIIKENMIPDNNILFCVQDKMGLVRHRELHESIDQNGKDVNAGQYIAELSYVIENPYCVVFLENVAP